MQRYMMIYKPGFESSAPPTQEEMMKVGGLIEEMSREGWLIMTDGLQHSAKGARIAIDRGQFTVIDGPFAEAKEVIGGFAIMRARSLDHAKELAKRFLTVMGEGSTEIRLMHDQPAFEEEARQRGRAAASS